CRIERDTMFGKIVATKSIEPHRAATKSSIPIPNPQFRSRADVDVLPIEPNKADIRCLSAGHHFYETNPRRSGQAEETFDTQLHHSDTAVLAEIGDGILNRTTALICISMTL